VPINDVDGSLKVIEYAMDTLKADGMAMWTSTPDKKYPGNDMYKPIMEELNRRKVAVFIHPADPWCCRNIDPPVPDIMGEYDFDVTRAGESLLMHGTFESNPDIRFIFVHSGGAIPMLAGRIRDRVKQGKREDLEPKVFDLLRKQYYDIAHASSRFPSGLSETLFLTRKSCSAPISRPRPSLPPRTRFQRSDFQRLVCRRSTTATPCACSRV